MHTAGQTVLGGMWAGSQVAGSADLLMVDMHKEADRARGPRGTPERGRRGAGIGAGECGPGGGGRGEQGTVCLHLLPVELSLQTLGSFAGARRGHSTDPGKTVVVRVGSDTGPKDLQV